MESVIELVWQRYTYNTMDEALGHSYCLYVFHHPDDGDRPFYIGKARFFGSKQASGHNGAARYNSGYLHLLAGMLRAGFSVYIAPLGEIMFPNAEAFEQELIAQWNPVRIQRIKSCRSAVSCVKPWTAASSSS